MLTFFDGVHDQIELFYFILLSLSIIALILYMVISNKKNKAILIDTKEKLRKNKAMIRINFKKEEILIYENNARKLSAKYSFVEFKSLIDFKYVDNFEEWLETIKFKQEKNKPSLSLYLINTTNSLKRYVKLTLLHYNKETDEVYASMEEVNRASIFSLKLMNNNEFYNAINELSGTKKNSVNGVVITMKVTNMGFLRKRYGNENANILLGEMFNRVSKLNEKDEVFTTYLPGNIFGIFKVDIKDKRQAKSYVKSLFEEIGNEPVDILNKQIEPTLHASYALYGEKTYDLKGLISFLMKSLNKNTFKISKNRYIYFENSMENDVINQNKDIEKVREIINNKDFKVTYEPVLCLERMNIIANVIHTRFNLYTPEDSFLTIYNLAEKHGLKKDFLNMYYRTLFDEFLRVETKNYRLLLRVDSSHLDIIRKIWLSNNAYLKIRLVLVVNYEDIIHPKKPIDYDKYIKEFMEMRIRFALLADENMLTIVSNVVNHVDMIIFDEFMTSNIEANDLRQISIDNIITNTQNNKIKYISYGINKYEQAEVLEKLGIDNLAGPYISKPNEDIHNHEFLKNRSVQALNSNNDNM